MNGFNFEKNLLHQTQAVTDIINIFKDLHIDRTENIDKHYENPEFNKTMSKNNYSINLNNSRVSNKRINADSNILDIMMETGTGKTYTYTKTIFELNRHFNIFKFVIVVPTLAIKAGTINFLKSNSCREHFKEQYGKTIQMHIVESKKHSKNNKSKFPHAVSSFVQSSRSDKNQIQVLIINSGMIYSETLHKSYDKSFFDKYSIPFEAIGACKPFLIIDEPHKFDQKNLIWKNLQKFNPQYILRFGATFTEHVNLIHNLTAVDAFNNNLVKGIRGFISKFDKKNDAAIKYIKTVDKEVVFELIEGTSTKTFNLTKGDGLGRIHPEIEELTIMQLNKNTVILSNGLELKKGDKISPYSYAKTIQESMISQAVKKHFELEQMLMTREVRIKPLTLFFIDNIEQYRSKDGNIRKMIEQHVENQINLLLKTDNLNSDYKEYLIESKKDISKTHGGYFSKDNNDKDETIEEEVEEILNDKQTLLSIKNPRRFIFSKWTLREGWDNPNVFQICKLRSSGSEISKLQEVGRGLRLPVNEFGNRVKGEEFFLNYFVDFTEADFVDKLVNEINEKSDAFPTQEIPQKLEQGLIDKIVSTYVIEEQLLLERLDAAKVINRANQFTQGGFEYLKSNFPLVFQGLKSGKVQKDIGSTKKVSIRTDKYSNLKALWEKLNEKVILEYRFDDESIFKNLLVEFFKGITEKLRPSEFRTVKKDVVVIGNVASVQEEVSIDIGEVVKFTTMRYSDFLKELSSRLYLNINTVHHAIGVSGFDVNSYLNEATIRSLKTAFSSYLLNKAFDVYSIEYKKVANAIHPTKFTNQDGNVLNKLNSSDIGVFRSDEKVADNYFLEELYYDSSLEKENIKTDVTEVVVFTKIPKSSIKIPVAGGKTYSPDFAYVLKDNDGYENIYFVVETKEKQSEELSSEEASKIRHANKLFGNDVNITFKTQLTNQRIEDIIREALRSE